MLQKFPGGQIPFFIALPNGKITARLLIPFEGVGR